MKKSPAIFATERIQVLKELALKTKDNELKKYYLELAKKICLRHRLKLHDFFLDKKSPNTVKKQVRIVNKKKVVRWIQL